jgi:phage-related baseplate assembly protein
MDVDGAWKVRDGYENISGIVLTTGTVPLLAEEDSAAALWLLAADETIVSSSVSSNVVTVACLTTHGLPSAHTTLLNISNLTYTGTDPNGNRVCTRTGTATFTFPLTTANETHGVAGSPRAKSFHIESAPAQIQGSCLFSDVTADNEEYIILATDINATAVCLGDLSKVFISYPTNEELAQSADLLQ